MSKLKLDIISQEKHLTSREVDMVLAPSMQGQIGILPGHISLFSSLVNGELVLVEGTKQEVFAVAGGFLDVNQDRVTVLANSAIHAQDIDVKQVEAAQARAKKAMREQELPEREMRLAEADLRRAILELKVAKRRHHGQVLLR